MQLRNPYDTRKELVYQIIEDWGPFLFLSIFYSFLQRLVNNFRSVNVEGVYNLEKIMFGWLMTNEDIPALAFKDINNPILTIFATFFYSMHFVVPAIVAIYIGYLKPDRETFSLYRISILLVTAFALTSFLIYPVAPPWYVSIYGFEQPINYTGTTETAAGLLKFDRLTNSNFFGSLYDTTPPAPFAAFPSLHASYSFLTAFVLVVQYQKSNKKIHLMWLYPFSVWFATVYLQHHYIVDLLGGMVYSLTSFLLGKYILLPLYRNYILPRLEKETKTND